MRQKTYFLLFMLLAVCVSMAALYVAAENLIAVVGAQLDAKDK
ncbi:MAG: hypothetical protein V4649_19625 [Bacteroidota bacterium]